jgi:hypothetical protein
MRERRLNASDRPLRPRELEKLRGSDLPKRKLRDCARRHKLRLRESERLRRRLRDFGRRKKLRPKD